jgi:hypothetical protein
LGSVGLFLCKDLCEFVGTVPKAKSSTLSPQSFVTTGNPDDLRRQLDKKFLHSAVTLIDGLIGVCRIAFLCVSIALLGRPGSDGFLLWTCSHQPKILILS